MGYNMGHLLYTTNPRDGINIRGHGQHIGGAIMDDHTSDSIPTKVCTKCGVEYPATLEFFYAKKSCKYGVNSYCKRCSVRVSIDNSRKNTEQARARRQRWTEKHPDKDRESKRLYYEKHRQEVIDKASDKQQHDKQWTANRNRKWKKDNPLKVLAMAHKRRALEMKAEGCFTAEDIRKIRKLQRERCYWCGNVLLDDVHIDHRVPLSRGGSNAPGNLVIACQHCNLSKSDKLPHEWCGRLL